MKRIVLCALALAWTAGAIAPDSQAQKRAGRTARRGQVYEITLGLAEAMRHLAANPDETLRILHELDRKFPGRERILSRIGSAHQVIGNADSAEVYFVRALTINPGSVDAGKALGQIYYGRGDEAKGRRVFDRLIEANGRSLSVFKVVGTALRDVGRYDEALRILEEGRRRNERNVVLALDIAALRQQTGDLTGALDEYLDYLDAQPRNYRFVRDRMVSVLRTAGDKEAALVGYLEKRVAAGNGNRYAMLDVMSARYLERGLLEKAIDAALRADGEPGSNGTVLLTLAEQVLQRALDRPRAEKPRYLELGVRALESFTRNHPKQPGTDRAMFMLASIHVQFAAGALPRADAAERRAYLEQAVGEYAELSRRYPNGSFAARAYLERGDLLLHRLRRPDEALEAYRSGAVNSRTLGPVFAARIAEVYLGTGDYESAQDYLGGMMESPSPELVQTAVYYTGLMLAFTGKYAAARDTLTYLAEEAPSAAWTNDAIDFAWVLEEALQYDSRALTDYLEAVRAQMAGDTAAAIARFEAVVDRPSYETLRPRALYRLGLLRFEAGQPRAALQALKRFLKDYPDENLRPDVQRAIARVYEQGFGQYERALREYEMVLVEHPAYPFLDEVRGDVRRLRNLVRGNERAN